MSPENFANPEESKAKKAAKIAFLTLILSLPGLAAVADSIAEQERNNTYIESVNQDQSADD